MKHFADTLAVADLVGSMGTFAAAQSEVDPATTTGTDFKAMSAADQRSALDTLQSADAGTLIDTGTTDTSMNTDTGANTSASSGAASSTMDSTGDASTFASASTDPEVQSVLTACEGNDDALVADQIKSQ